MPWLTFVTARGATGIGSVVWRIRSNRPSLGSAIRESSIANSNYPENLPAWQAIAPAGEAALRSALAQGSAQTQGGRGGAGSAELITSYAWATLSLSFIGYWGAAAIVTCSYYPIVFLLVAASLRVMDPDLEETAR